MRGDRVPHQDHVARYCPFSKLSADGQIQATAFMLRSDEINLSVNWLEFLNCSSRDDEIMEIRSIYSRKFSRVGAQAKLAILNVGEMHENVLIKTQDSRNLEVLHEPIVNDQSHSEIYNLRPDEELVAELILETVCESHSAR